MNLQKITCFFKGHEWTNKYMEGIKPDPNEVKNAANFFEYAKMYCKRCGRVSELSERAIREYKGNK